MDYINLFIAVGTSKKSLWSCLYHRSLPSLCYFAPKVPAAKELTDW